MPTEDLDNQLMLIEKINNVAADETLAHYKNLAVARACAPLDGMWLCGFIPQATHYAFVEAEQSLGFCCVNEEGYLLQFYAHNRFDAPRLFAALLEQHEGSQNRVNGAFISTAEPETLSLCLDHFVNFEVNALMYQFENDSDLLRTATAHDERRLELLGLTHLASAVDFASAGVGASETWLHDYYRNLIRREELFGRWDNDALIALGECRGYDDYQIQFADLGVIVAHTHRNKGLATRVLKELNAINQAKGRTSICSTERDNLAAQKAIGRAGFVAKHRLIRFSR